MNIAKTFAVMLLCCNFAMAGSRGADDYQFGEKEYEHTEITVKIVVMKNPVEFRKLASAHGLRRETVTALKGKMIVEAFSVLHPKDQQCTVFIKDPDWEWQPEYIGHELAHCVWGRWHD